MVFLGLFWPGLKNFNKLKVLAKDKHSGVFVLWVSEGNGYLHLYCLNYISCSFSSLTFHCRLLARMSVRRRMSRSVPRQRDASLQERRLRSFRRIAQPGDGVSNTFWHNVLTYYVFFSWTCSFLQLVKWTATEFTQREWTRTKLGDPQSEVCLSFPRLEQKFLPLLLIFVEQG